MWLGLNRCCCDIVRARATGLASCRLLGADLVDRIDPLTQRHFSGMRRKTLEASGTHKVHAM